MIVTIKASMIVNAPIRADRFFICRRCPGKLSRRHHHIIPLAFPQQKIFPKQQIIRTNPAG
jgi:hypothetical protein